MQHRSEPSGQLTDPTTERPTTRQSASSVFGDDLDRADDVPVELPQVLCRDSLFGEVPPIHLVLFESVEVVLGDWEAGDVAHGSVVAILGVPLASDEGRVALAEDWVEDRLPVEARWELAEPEPAMR